MERFSNKIEVLFLARMLDLFSGIGGFAYAAKQIWGDDLEIAAFCERDEFCRKVLKKRFPSVPIIDDIHEMNGKNYGTVDLICGGFPCQPVSVAGKQMGQADDRWLWPEMFRVCRDARPRWVIAENVPGLIAMELDGVLADLESEGYQTGTLVLPACGVGAPHRRERVWIVGHAGGGGSAGVLPDTNNTGRQKQRQQKPAGEEHTAAERCCRWPAEPELGRVAYGVPRRVDRLRALGNAIVPQVAMEIFRAIRKIDYGQA